VGSFAAIGILMALHRYAFEPTGHVGIVGSMGASAGSLLASLAGRVLDPVGSNGTPLSDAAVLVFGASASPLSQPRNVIGGHALSAFIGSSSVRQFRWSSSTEVPSRYARLCRRELHAVFSSCGAVGAVAWRRHGRIVVNRRHARYQNTTPARYCAPSYHSPPRNRSFVHPSSDEFGTDGTSANTARS
jgi:hypothetical protein